MSPLKLTDDQLSAVMDAARLLPSDKRGGFLERVSAYLGQIGYLRVGDADVQDAVRLALQGLVHESAA
jgi:hypothetical protein